MAPQQLPAAAPRLAVLLAGAAVAGRPASAEGQPFQVLLTGFGPFLNFTTNPTMQIANILGSSCEDVEILPEPSEEHPGQQPSATVPICWHSHVLPVNRTGALWTTSHLRDFIRSGAKVPYDAIFHLGLEDVAKGLKLEVAAANVLAKDSGEPGTQPAILGAPRLSATTVNVGWMDLKNLAIIDNASQTNGSTQTELWSRNPGKYYCNEVYYRTLQLVRSQPLTGSCGALLPSMFVHVQNTTRASVHQDVYNVRKIVAHALWATYVAPQRQRRAQQLALSVPPPVPAVALLALGSFALGCCCTAAAWVAARRRSDPRILQALLAA